MFDTYARSRPATTRLLDMMDNGEIDVRAVAEMALMWLAESEVKEMMLANDILDEDEDDEEDEYDGQPDEAQEWESFDPEC